jgi:hypothetical protein
VNPRNFDTATPTGTFHLFREAFGQRTTVKFSVIPVIPSLVHNPLFGHKEK